MENIRLSKFTLLLYYFITLLSKEIYPVSSAKDLGIILDKSLIYDGHITEVVSKCVAALCQINRVKHLLDKKTIVTLIKLSYVVNYSIVRQFGPTIGL